MPAINASAHFDLEDASTYLLRVQSTQPSAQAKSLQLLGNVELQDSQSTLVLRIRDSLLLASPRRVREAMLARAVRDTAELDGDTDDAGARECAAMLATDDGQCKLKCAHGRACVHMLASPSTLTSMRSAFE
jgi:hypothetical protein